MLTALVLICSVVLTPDLRDCSHGNATAVLRVPGEFGNPGTCFMHGQAYIADTSLGRDLAQGEAIKVVCVRSSAAKVDKADMQR